jgi:rod shape-determining protein MreC
MESVLGRYRNLVILVGVLFLQVLGLAVQVKRGSDADSTRLIRIWTVGAITPLERALVWVQNSGGGLWHNYFYLRGVRAENRQLKEEIEHMKLQQVRLNEDATQAHRLQALLAFKEQYISKTVPAQVIGSSASDLSRSIYIDKGSDEGIQPDMAVITANGIVGKVLRVYPSTSLVLLLNDQSSGVGAILEKSRLQGVLRGSATGEVQLERVMSDEQVTAGETVLTSGGDQVFPKGLPVGTVARVDSAKDLFLNIKVKPAANLSRLEEVLVVLEKQERQATAQETVRVRAADILAQRLPSVPDKPAVDANAASAPAGTTVPGAKNSTPQTPPGAASKPGTQPQTAKPNAVDATGAKPNATTPNVSAPASGQKPAGGDGAHTGTAVQPGAPGAVKTATPKAAPANGIPKSGTGPGVGAKPATSEPKAAKPNPKPPATDDGPH